GGMPARPARAPPWSRLAAEGERDCAGGAGSASGPGPKPPVSRSPSSLRVVIEGDAQHVRDPLLELGERVCARSQPPVLPLQLEDPAVPRIRRTGPIPRPGPAAPGC